MHSGRVRIPVPVSPRAGGCRMWQQARTERGRRRYHHILHLDSSSPDPGSSVLASPPLSHLATVVSRQLFSVQELPRLSSYSLLTPLIWYGLAWFGPVRSSLSTSTIPHPSSLPLPQTDRLELIIQTAVRPFNPTFCCSRRPWPTSDECGHASGYYLLRS